MQAFHWTYQQFVTIYSCAVFHYKNIQQLFIHSLVDWYFSFLQFGATVNKDTVKLWVVILSVKIPHWNAKVWFIALTSNSSFLLTRILGVKSDGSNGGIPLMSSKFWTLPWPLWAFKKWTRGQQPHLSPCLYLACSFSLPLR